MGFLDKTGFQYFWNKLKSYVSTQIDNIPEAGTYHSGLMSIADKQTIDKYKSMWQDMYGSGIDYNMPLQSVNVSQSGGKLTMQTGTQDYSKATNNIKETITFPTATTSSDGVMSSSDKTTLNGLNSKLSGINFSDYFKEGNIYTTADKTVALDLKCLRDVKVLSYDGGKLEAAIIGHLHSDKGSKSSVIYQDGISSLGNPFLIETIPYFGILLGESKTPNTGPFPNIAAGAGNYSTYIGRGIVAVSNSQEFTNIQTGKRVQLTSKGYRPVDKQGGVTIDDAWAKNNMNNIATCNFTMVDAKVIDIDYDHKIATVRITVQDTKRQIFYVKTEGAVIEGAMSSAVDGEYYANVVLQVPYDSSGKVSLYDKYTITTKFLAQIGQKLDVSQAIDSNAEGKGTITRNVGENANGTFNVSNTGNTDDLKTIHSIGIGTKDVRKNAQEVMVNGDHYIYGIGSYDGINYSSAQTLQEVISNIQNTIWTGTQTQYDQLESKNENTLYFITE